MSDTTAIPHIKISNPEQFRALVVELNKTRSDAEKIKTGERGRLPMRTVAPIIVRAQLDGKLTFEDTDYFQISRWAFGETVGTRKAKADTEYEITYKVLNKNGKEMPNTITLTLSENQIRSYLPNVKGMISSAFATMAVALHKAKEGAPLSDVNRYVVTSVARKEIVESSQINAETTNVAPKGDDTGDAPEDVHASEELLNAVIAAGEESVSDDAPELVSA